MEDAQQPPAATTSTQSSDTPDDPQREDLQTKAEPRDFWNEAYKKVKEENPKLMTLHEKLLLESGNAMKNGNFKEDANAIEDEDPETGMQRQEQLQSFVKDILRDVEVSKSSVTIGGKKIYPKKVAQHAVHGIIAIKDVISPVVSSEPHGAVAWAGVLVILPVSDSVYWC